MTTEEFETLSPIEKNKAIAKDVLLNMKIGRYRFLTGTYASEYSEYSTEPEGDFFCKVCACGAAAVSHLHLLSRHLSRCDADFEEMARSLADGSDEGFGQLPFLFDDPDASTKLFPGMTIKEVGLLELFYMGSAVDSWSSRFSDDDFLEQAKRFCERYPHEDDRAALIFEQIAETGKFDPEDLPGYPWYDDEEPTEEDC